MPPKRKARPVTTTATPKLDYDHRLKISNKEEKNIRNIVQNIMFSCGDAEIPITDNEDLVIDLLKNELIFILEDIQSLKNDHKSPINLQDLLMILQNQTGLISRFLKYLATRVKMAEYSKTSCSSNKRNICGEDLESDNDEDDAKTANRDDVDEIGDVDGEEGEYLSKKRRKMAAVDSEEQLLDEVRKCFENAGLDINEDFVDEIHNERQKALLKTISEMDPDEYTSYTNARRVSFQRNSTFRVFYDSDGSSARRKKRSPPVDNLTSLLIWIGDPPIVGKTAEMLIAFVAKELVMEVVGAALIEKIREPEGIFKNSPNFQPNALQARHYEEAIRKNRKLRKYGRIFV